MVSKITMKDIYGVTSKELKEFTAELKSTIKEAEKLRDMGIVIEGKSLKELICLIEKNKS